MERELERTKEREPLAFFDSARERVEWDIAMRRRLMGPRVVKFDSVPWVTSSTDRLHKQFVWPPWQETQYKWPIRTMFAAEQVIPPKQVGALRHRHYNEAIFYVIEGKGHEIHDGIRYDWQAGDIYTIPVYADHQHINDSPTEPARLFLSANSYIYTFAGMSHVDQLKLPKTPPDADPILGPEGEVLGFRYKDGLELRFGLDPAWEARIRYATTNPLVTKPAKTTYDGYVTRLKDEFEFTLKQPHVVKQRDVPWEDTRMGRIKFMVHPGRITGMYLYDAFIQEIPPGGRSGKHRHLSEELHLIVEGKGYDVHDGGRWEWEKEDVVCIPTGVVHQHFNADAHRPARFVAFQSRLAMAMGHGGIEHLEDCPEFRE